MKIARGMMMKAALLATLALPILTVPAFGQQEVDPTWYNPWPNANKPAAQQEKAKPATSNNDKQARKAKAASESKTKSAKHAPAQEPVRTAQAQPQSPSGAN